MRTAQHQPDSNDYIMAVCGCVCVKRQFACVLGRCCARETIQLIIVEICCPSPKQQRLCVWHSLVLLLHEHTRAQRIEESHFAIRAGPRVGSEITEPQTFPLSILHQRQCLLLCLYCMLEPCVIRAFATGAFRCDFQWCQHLTEQNGENKAAFYVLFYWSGSS